MRCTNVELMLDVVPRIGFAYNLHRPIHLRPSILCPGLRQQATPVETIDLQGLATFRPLIIMNRSSHLPSAHPEDILVPLSEYNQSLRLQ